MRGNILFGRGHGKVKYKEVINACALGPDLNILAGGDMTEIEEKAYDFKKQIIFKIENIKN